MDRRKAVIADGRGEGRGGYQYGKNESNHSRVINVDFSANQIHPVLEEGILRSKMRFGILDPALRRIQKDESFRYPKFDRAPHRSFRKVMNLISAARDERDLRAIKSLRLEKLVGDRSGQQSLRLNSQFRLIVQFRLEPGGNVVVVIEIVDYH